MAQFVDKYVWLIFLVWAISSTFSVRSELKAFPENRPSLSVGDRLFFAGYFLFWGLPWIVMGVGILIGGAPGMITYLKCGRNVYVISFVATCLSLFWSVGIWIVLMGGADYLSRYKIIDVKSPRKLKLQYAIGLLAVTLIFVSCLMY